MVSAAGHLGEPRLLPLTQITSRTLIILGLVLVAVGPLWPWLGRFGLGRLLISVALSLILWLFSLKLHPRK